MKNISKVFLVLVFSMILANVVYGAGAAGMQQGFNTANYGQYVDVQTASPLVFVGTVLQSVLTLMGAIAVIMIIYAGVLISSSRGKEDTYKQGIKIIKYAIIGLIIIIASWSIVFWVTGSNSFLWSSQQTV